MRRCLLIAVLLLIAVGEGKTQTKPQTSGFPRERSVGIFGGYSWPLGRGGFTEYWQPGPAAGVELLTRVSRHLSFGIGMSVAAYWFRQGKFGSDHPGVAAHNLPVAHASLALMGRLDVLPSRRVDPYLGFSFGLVRMSGAVYTEVVNSVRVTYYDLPVSTRLTFGLSPGVDFRLSRGVAIDTEVGFLHVINDPNVSWTVNPRAGIRLIF